MATFEVWKKKTQKVNKKKKKITINKFKLFIMMEDEKKSIFRKSNMKMKRIYNQRQLIVYVCMVMYEL